MNQIRRTFISLWGDLHSPHRPPHFANSNKLNCYDSIRHFFPWKTKGKAKSEQWYREISNTPIVWDHGLGVAGLWHGGEGGCGVGEYPACLFASGKCSSYDSSPEKNTPDPSLSPYSSSLPRHCPLIDYLRTFKRRIWGGCWGGELCVKNSNV